QTPSKLSVLKGHMMVPFKKSRRGSRALMAMLATGGALSLLVACSMSPSSAESDSNANTESSSGECVPKHEFDTIKDGVIQAASMTEFPSFQATSDDSFEGFSYTMMEEFAAQNCKTVDYQVGNGPQVTLALS